MSVINYLYKKCINSLNYLKDSQTMYVQLGIIDKLINVVGVITVLRE